MTTFVPDLSKIMLHRIDLLLACEADWLKQHSNSDLKPPFGLFESGLFSGGDERSEPQAFRVERAQSQKDGSFRVDVGLTWGMTDRAFVRKK
jgi:hypothetical protein